MERYIKYAYQDNAGSRHLMANPFSEQLSYQNLHTESRAMAWEIDLGIQSNRYPGILFKRISRLQYHTCREFANKERSVCIKPPY